MEEFTEPEYDQVHQEQIAASEMPENIAEIPGVQEQVIVQVNSELQVMKPACSGEEAGHETYCGLRAPMPLPPGTRPAPLSEVAGPQRSDRTARHFAVEPPFPGRVVLVQEPVAHDNTTTRFLLGMALLRKEEEEEVRKREEEEELKRIRNIPLNQVTPLQQHKLVCWMDKEKEKEKAKAAVGISPSTSSSSSGFSRKRKKKRRKRTRRRR